MSDNNVHLEIRWKNLEKDHKLEHYLQERLNKVHDFKFTNLEAPVKTEVVYYEKTNSYKSSAKIIIKGSKHSIFAESKIDHSLSVVIHDLVDKILDQLRRIKTQYYK
ncbi:HPF/RaiA family ribosome-associated protein [Candidatus Mycoplasma pogonae]